MGTILSTSLTFLVLAVPTASAQVELAGSWEGAISDGTRSVRTVLHLSPDDEGRLVGTVDSPEQNAFGLGLSEVAFAEGALSFRVPDTNGAWTGKLDSESGLLIGIWKQRGADLELVLERIDVDPLVGTWSGKGDFGPIELRIVFHVGTRADGSFGASMVSPDQSPAYVPVTSVSVGEDGTLSLEVSTISARYEGRPNAECTRIEGHLLQGGGKFKLNLEKIGGVAAPARPQTPTPPFLYREEQVTYTNEAAGNRLAGTLTLPQENGPFPAVLLISGSGQQDRNEEIFGHKPFHVIADHLTRNGIAVLRVDDRGIGGSTGDVLEATSADFASDAEAGVTYLRTRNDIRAGAIGLVGHSEGGMIGPMVAVERDDIAFLVLLAGVGIPGDELLYRQAALLARAGGAGEALVAANRKMQEELFQLLREEFDRRKVRNKSKEILTRHLGDRGNAQLPSVTTAWFQYFVNYDPAPILEQVACPVLALNGSKDLQVPARENLEAIAAALEAGGNKDVETKEYAGLNHLFQHCEKGTVGEYATIEETFAPEVLEDMATWIERQASHHDR